MEPHDRLRPYLGRVRNCYALALAKRLKAMGQAKYQVDGDVRTSGPGFGLTLHADSLRLPYSWAGRRVVFVNSMSDLFHRVPLGFVRDVFAVIADTPQHTYQVLTKRSSRLPRIAEKLDWPSNLWLGVSVEDKDALFRVGRPTVGPGGSPVHFVRATAGSPGRAGSGRDRLGHCGRRVRPQSSSSGSALGGSHS